MLRRLIVMRHAKSDWKTDAPTDHARPLNARGRRDAPRVAARLSELGWEPDVVISSDSKRTRETWQLMEDHFTGDVNAKFLASLYHAAAAELADALRMVPDTAHTVLALGHNPGWSGAVHWLTGASVGLTTANAALCTIKAETWNEAVHLSGNWTLEEIIRPKEL